MTIQARLKEELGAAMRRRDRIEMEVLRNLISAVDNAGAVDAVHEPLPKLGLDFDVPRREVSAGGVHAIIVAGRDELLPQAARTYRDLGRADAGEELESKAAVAGRFLE